MGPPSSPGQLALLAAMLIYDLAMLGHVHVYQTSLAQIGSSYAPIHPFITGLGAPDAVLFMTHAWWLVVIHGIGSAFPLVASAAQLAGPIRRRWPRVHRVNGWAVLGFTVLCGALPGMWMATHIVHASWALRIMVVGLGALVLLAVAMVVRTIRAGELAAHMRWAARLYAYLHVIPVFARLYFALIWAGWTAEHGAGQGAAAAGTFEIIGWLTVVSVIPLGELMARVVFRPPPSPDR